ncbi:hypothetical protein, partial [Deinococcus arcticus]
QGQEHVEEDVIGQLFVLKTSVYSLFSGFRRRFTGQERSQDPVTGRLCLNQGFDHVSDTLQRVAPEEGKSCFQQVGEMGTLTWSGIVDCHRPVMPLLCCPQCGHG